MTRALLLLLLTSPLVKARPYYSRVPTGYDAAKPAPLLVLLHPYYPGDGRRAAEMYQLAPILDQKGLLFAAPDGTLEGSYPGSKRFWNATDACCDLGGKSGVDDVAYLSTVIADMSARYRVDPRRIFLLGYSNGGYMTHRLLCEHPEVIAAGASIAGAGWKDHTRCKPSQAASLLEVHGDQDDVVKYQGGDFGGKAAYPSAQEGVADWAKKIGCGAAAAAGAARDLIPDLSGAETTVSQYSCPAGAAELWTVHGGAHRGLAPAMRAAIDFLLAHPKP